MEEIKMKVLVDTSIWSVALRKKKLTDHEELLVKELKELIYELRVEMIGPIRQELLSGIAEQKQFEKLKEHLKAFDNLNIRKEDYELAAEFFNLCRKNGVQGSHVDFLICAVAKSNNLSIFTTDNDFFEYKKHIDIKIYRFRDDL